MADTVSNIDPNRNTASEFRISDDNDKELEELRNTIKLNEETQQNKIKSYELDHKNLTDKLKQITTDNEDMINYYKNEIQKLKADLDKYLNQENKQDNEETIK